VRQCVFLLLLLCSSFLLSACREGKTVDKQPNLYVDPQSGGTFVDSGSGSSIDNPAPKPADNPVLSDNDSGFRAPPGNYTQNATIDLDTKKAFVGRDVVKLWVWNDRGSQAIIAPEGSSVSVSKLGLTVKIGPIGHDGGGKTVVSVNGVDSKVLSYRQETKVGSTWIFVSDFFLNAAQ
jgi:hypothetical protein